LRACNFIPRKTPAVIVTTNITGNQITTLRVLLSILIIQLQILIKPGDPAPSGFGASGF
jgi:hypothetical protein